MQNTPRRRLSKTLLTIEPRRRLSKTLLTIDTRGSNSIETVFSIAICRQLDDKWQSKTVSNEFYLRSSSVLEFSIAYYPGCDYAACNNVLGFQTVKISLSIAKKMFFCY